MRYYTFFKEAIPADTTIHMYLVNDGSKFGIHQEDIEFLHREIVGFTYIDSQVNKGKGGALRDAVRLTSGKWVIYTDSDYPYIIENAVEMFHLLSTDAADIVVGVRDEPYYDQLPFGRKIFSLSLKVMNYLFFPYLKVKDTQSGLKGFNQKGKEIFLKTRIHAFLFDMEFLVLASKDPAIRIQWIYVQARKGIMFSTMRAKTILTELANFVSILFSRRK